MTDTGRRTDPPERLWWLYLLLGAALAAVGAAAGQGLFVIYDLRRFAAVRNCLLDHGVMLGQPWPVDQHTTRALAACATSYQAAEGTVMATGAVLVPLLAWLLMLGGGLTMRVRLRRRGAVSYRSSALDAVRERFEYRCDQAGLTGRRRPVLLLGRPGRLTGQAYCISVPLSRPVVVIPAGYAYRDTDELDLVVVHELAHVRAGDIAWAAAAWWTGWLNLPVLLIVIGPLLRHPGLFAGSFGLSTASGLASALALSLATLTLRAALLRHRERAADRYALAVTGHPQALRSALGTRPTGTHRGGSWLGRWTAVHPPPDARLSAATAPISAQDAWRGGFGMAAAASVVALFGFQRLWTVLFDLLGFPRLSNAWLSNAGPSGPQIADAALAIAALLWAGILVPVWARAGATHGWRGRWPAVAGSTAGLLAGLFLWSPGSLLPAPQVLARDVPLAVGWSAVAAVAATLFALGLAVPLHAGPRAAGRHPVVRLGAVLAAVLGAAAALTAGLGLSTAVVGYDRLGASAAVQRALLPGAVGTWWGRWMPALILLGAAAVALAAQPAGLRPTLLFGRRGWLVVAAAAVTAAVAGVTLSQLRTGSLHTADGRYLLVVRRWWICAAAGWVTTVAVLFARRPAAPADGDDRTVGRGYPLTLPPALLAGAVAAALAGAAQYARDALAGRSGQLVPHLWSDVQHPVWLDLVLVAVSLPVLVVCWQLTARRGDVGRARSWRPVAGAVAASAVLATAIATGFAFPVTIAAGDYNRMVAWVPTAPAPPSATALPHPSGPTAAAVADPGRPIDPTTAGTALDAVRGVLPTGWAPAVNTTTQGVGVQPDSCRDLFNRDEAADQARPKAADETRTYSVQPNQIPPLGAAVVVSLTSYRSPQGAAQSFAALPAEAAECPRWSSQLSQADDKRIHAAVTAPPPPALPYASYQAIVEYTYREHSTSVTITTVRLWSLIGHNMVEATAQYPHLEATIPAGQLAFLHDLTAAADSQIIASLR